MYDYPSLRLFHDQVNKRIPKGKTWERRFFLISSLFLYMQYSEAQVIIQRESIDQSLVKDLETKKPEKYSDLTVKVYSSSISAYSHFCACLEIGQRLQKLPNWQSWIHDIKEKRNRLSAHPDSKGFGQKKINLIAWKRSSYSSTGEIKYRVLHIDKGLPYAYVAKEISLHPEKDFNKLKVFVDDLIVELRKSWRIKKR